MQRAFHDLALRSGNTPQKNDAIIIYYAGYAGPSEGDFDGLQDLVPWDYNPSKENGIPLITSHEIRTALAEVRRMKGDHIVSVSRQLFLLTLTKCGFQTIVLDCGGSPKERVQRDGGRYISRVIPLAQVQVKSERIIPEKNVISGNVFVLSPFSKGEYAWECLGRGLFTSAVIKLLSHNSGSTNTTRLNLLSKLPPITGSVTLFFTNIVLF